MKSKKLISAAAALVMCLSMAGAPAGSALSAPSISAYAAVYETDTAVQYAQQVAKLVNEKRAANGLSPLKLSDELCNAANVRAKEIQTTFSHTRPNGTSCFTAVKEQGISYTYAAENIAYGQKTPQAVMNSWMNSSGHRANILSSKAEYIGVGVAYKNGTYYWTQFFASGKGMSGNAVAAVTPSAGKPETVTPASGSTNAQNNTCTNGKCDTQKLSYKDLIAQLMKKLQVKNCK